MRLGVSAWRLSGQRLGIGRYIEYMLRHWSTILEPADKVDVFVHEAFDTKELGLSKAFSPYVIQPALKNAIWENLLLPRYTRDLDVLFGPSYTLPLRPRCRSVVAIHSVDESEGARPWWHDYTYGQKYRWSAQTADRVIANSHYVKQRLETCYGIAGNKIEVVWLGADEAFRPLNDPVLLRATRVKYFGSDRPFVLFMGGLSRRRNIPILLEAFSILKKKDRFPHGLLLMGPNRANIPLGELTARLGIADSVVHTVGQVADHHELVPVYCAADAFVLPSSSEGFSLTLAEAMACGTPVITVNRAALGEVAHGYGMTIEQPTVPALAEAMRQVLDDPELRSELSRKGLERARELRWPEAARRTLNVLREVAQQ
jgi:glycosyltransferase involved in cell wall biosynthesis